ncbi:MAG: hypothetical protein ABIP04_05600 [Sulfuriferula sp.]
MSTEGKELSFAFLILLSPHTSLVVALWICGVMLALSILTSNAVIEAKDRLWSHLSGGG